MQIGEQPWADVRKLLDHQGQTAGNPIFHVISYVCGLNVSLTLSLICHFAFLGRTVNQDLRLLLHVIWPFPGLQIGKQLPKLVASRV